MTAVIVRPYRSASEEAVSLGEWMLRQGDDLRPLPALLMDWDPATPVMVERSAEVNVDLLREQCSLNEDDRASVVLLWKCAASGLRGSSARHVLATGSDGRADLRLELDGGQLAGVVDLRAAVLLDERRSVASRFAAHLPGSVLWTEDRARRVEVEGSASRFPIELVEFGGADHLPAGASWVLDADFGSLDQAALGNLVLLVNRDRAAVVDAVSGGMTERDQLIRSMIRLDVARQLVVGALLSDDFDPDSAEWDPNSLGAIAHRLIAAFFPRDSLDRLRADARSASPRIEATIQASSRFLAL
jgi:hypothetical protein